MDFCDLPWILRPTETAAVVETSSHVEEEASPSTADGSNDYTNEEATTYDTNEGSPLTQSLIGDDDIVGDDDEEWYEEEVNENNEAVARTTSSPLTQPLMGGNHRASVWEHEAFGVIPDHVSSPYLYTKRVVITYDHRLTRQVKHFPEICITDV